MRKILYIFAFLLLVGNTAHTADTKRVFILHSYSQEYAWTKKQHEGFIKSLKQKYTQPVEICTEYLDTKRVMMNGEYQAKFLNYLLMKYNGYTPDAIYVSDDDALSFIINSQERLFPDSPVVFSGINNLSLKNSLDKNRYVGVYEIKEIVPNIELIRTFSPQTRDIWFVGDTSKTYAAIESELTRESKKFPKFKMHFIASKKLDEAVSKLESLPPRSFVVLTTIGGFVKADGTTSTLQESISRLCSIKNLIMMSMEDAYIIGGVIGGFVTDGNKQGGTAANMVAQILQGVKAANIESVSSGANSFMFDKKAVQNSRLILSEYTARNAILLNQEASFVATYQTQILSGLFIVFVVMILLLVVAYFMLRRKSEELEWLRRGDAKPSAHTIDNTDNNSAR